jgi:hypothetical protein
LAIMFEMKLLKTCVCQTERKRRALIWIELWAYRKLLGNKQGACGDPVLRGWVGAGIDTRALASVVAVHVQTNAPLR